MYANAGISERDPEAARTVREAGPWRDLPMVALTSRVEPRDIERGRAGLMGVYGYTLYFPGTDNDYRLSDKPWWAMPGTSDAIESEAHGAWMQREMQRESREFTALSNIMKVRHDTAKSAINNVR